MVCLVFPSQATLELIFDARGTNLIMRQLTVVNQNLIGSWLFNTWLLKKMVSASSVKKIWSHHSSSPSCRTVGPHT